MKRLLVILCLASLPVLVMGASRFFKPRWHITFDEQEAAATAVNLPRGSGGGTFDRDSVGTRFDPDDGQVGEVGSDVPSIGAPLASGNLLPTSGDPVGLYLGGGGAALINRNEELDGTGWTETGTSVVSADTCTTTDPDGGSNADVLTDDDGSGDEFVEQTVTISVGKEIVVTSWVHPNATETDNVFIEFDDANPAGTVISSSDGNDGWERIIGTFDNVSGSSVVVNLMPTTRSGAGAATDSNCWWRPTAYALNQLHDIQHSPLTLDLDVTIDDDTINYTVARGGNHGDRGTFCTYLWLYDAGTPARGVMAFDGTGTDHDMRITIENGRPTFETFGLTGNAAAACDTQITEREWTWVCWRWDQPNSNVDCLIGTTHQTSLNASVNDETWDASSDYDDVMSLSHAADTDTDDPLDGFLSYSFYWPGEVVPIEHLKNLKGIADNKGGFAALEPGGWSDTMFARLYDPDLETLMRNSGLKSRGALGPLAALLGIPGPERLPWPMWARSYDPDNPLRVE